MNATPDAADLDDFRAAQARHRLPARLRAIPAILAAAVMGIPLSVYLSPVLLALAIVVTDLVNLVVRAPDLGGGVMDLLDRLIDGDPGTVQAIVLILLFWLIPGIVGLTIAYLVVRSRLRHIGGDGIAAALGARAPLDTDPEERQLIDVVGELAVAASITAPRVLLYDDGPANALVYGSHPDRATILVGRPLLAELDRAHYRTVDFDGVDDVALVVQIVGRSVGSTRRPPTGHTGFGEDVAQARPVAWAQPAQH